MPETQPEPLAAILREMRDYADRRAADAGGERPAIELLRSYADRIAEAVERERVKVRRDAEIEWTRIGYDERKAEEKRAPGNAAAMREALAESTALLAVINGDEYEENVTRQISRNTDVLSAPPEPPSNAAAMRKELNSIANIAEDAFGGPERHREASQGRALSLIIDAARATLSAPARNCDCLADCNSAWKAYNAIENRERLPGFDFWLFDTAKGGAK